MTREISILVFNNHNGLDIQEYKQYTKNVAETKDYINEVLTKDFKVSSYTTCNRVEVTIRVSEDKTAIITSILQGTEQKDKEK